MATIEPAILGFRWAFATGKLSLMAWSALFFVKWWKLELKLR
jgi:hypothetical protein